MVSKGFLDLEPPGFLGSGDGLVVLFKDENAFLLKGFPFLLQDDSGFCEALLVEPNVLGGSSEMGFCFMDLMEHTHLLRISSTWVVDVAAGLSPLYGFPMNLMFLSVCDGFLRYVLGNTKVFVRIELGLQVGDVKDKRTASGSFSFLENFEVNFLAF